ncbi:MAG: TIM barrel protein [Pirellulales bacterium]
MSNTTRRDFIKSSAACLTAASLPLAANSIASADMKKSNTPKGFKKSIKIGMVKLPGSLAEKMQVLKELGYDALELNSPGGPSADEVKAAIDKTGLPIHGVVDSVHWRERLSDPNADVRAKGLEALKTAIRASKSYGGTSVLLVPGRVTKDVTYEQCWERSIAEIKKAIPLAEELNIQILMENVWNDFLTDPTETARFIDELESDHVGAYFDVGNAVRYSPPHEWVPILGKRIKKLDIKDFSKDGRGFGADILDGDVDWPKVMQELHKIGFTGYGTAEIRGGDKARLTEIAKRMNTIFDYYPA